MFYLAKIAAFLAQPSTLAVAAIALGLLLVTRSERRRRLGSRLAWGGLAFLLVAGLTPLGNAIILPLEQRFADAKLPSPGDRVDGIIVLGGFEDGWVSAGRGGLAVNEAAERLTETLRLARAHPDARVVFTGGVGQVWGRGLEATGPVAAFLADAGIEPSRIALEPAARNTAENAARTRDLVRPKPDEVWLLITSASHMPRAVGLFRAAGFKVVPAPVDYRTRDAGDVLRPFERIPAGLQRTDLAVNEWLGLIANRLLGRTPELLPGP